MQREFFAHGAVATDSLIFALQRDSGPWAHAVLQQCFSMPLEYRTSLLTGEIEWKVKNEKMLVTSPLESPSLPKQGSSGTSSPST